MIYANPALAPPRSKLLKTCAARVVEMTSKTLNALQLARRVWQSIGKKVVGRNTNPVIVRFLQNLSLTLGRYGVAVFPSPNIRWGKAKPFGKSRIDAAKISVHDMGHNIHELRNINILLITQPFFSTLCRFLP